MLCATNEQDAALYDQLYEMMHDSAVLMQLSWAKEAIRLMADCEARPLTETLTDISDIDVRPKSPMSYSDEDGLVGLS